MLTAWRKPADIIACIAQTEAELHRISRAFRSAFPLGILTVLENRMFALTGLDVVHEWFNYLRLSKFGDIANVRTSFLSKCEPHTKAVQRLNEELLRTFIWYRNRRLSGNTWAHTYIPQKWRRSNGSRLTSTGTLSSGLFSLCYFPHVTLPMRVVFPRALFP